MRLRGSRCPAPWRRSAGVLPVGRSCEACRPPARSTGSFRCRGGADGMRPAAGSEQCRSIARGRTLRLPPDPVKTANHKMLWYESRCHRYMWCRGAFCGQARSRLLMTARALWTACGRLPWATPAAPLRSRAQAAHGDAGRLRSGGSIVQTFDSGGAGERPRLPDEPAVSGPGHHSASWTTFGSAHCSAQPDPGAAGANRMSPRVPP